MAKRICDPTSGKIGNQVYQNSRNGQVVRTRAIPTNPKTAEQVLARNRLAAMAVTYDALSEAQQNAWIAAAEYYQSRSRLGMSGPLTGLQLYVKVNCALLEIGQAAVSTPPTTPTYDALTVSTLTCVLTGGVPVIKAAVDDDFGDYWRILAAAPVNPGVRRQPDLVHIGAAPVVSGGFSTFTSLYTALFGTPVAGKRLHVRFTQQVNGLYGPEFNLTCLVTGS